MKKKKNKWENKIFLITSLKILNQKGLWLYKKN